MAAACVARIFETIIVAASKAAAASASADRIIQISFNGWVGRRSDRSSPTLKEAEQGLKCCSAGGGQIACMTDCLC